jgi:hypothetical protein
MLRVIAQLKGGLGNQMFQYAAARNLAEMSNAELIIDSHSGFARDFQYKRTYELNSLPIVGKEAGWFDRLPFWFENFDQFVHRRLNIKGLRNFHFRPRGRLCLEPSERRFDPEVLRHPIVNDSWMAGYWQSPGYFSRISDILARELSPPRPRTAQALAMGDKAAEKPSVAIGVRLFEESAQTGVHSRDGHIKNIDQINESLKSISDRIGSANFFIFCSHRAEILSEIKTPTPPLFVTGDEGFRDAVESLWILRQCQHHIFTNSSFYWWGAWLAENGNRDDCHHIIAADNFINEDAIPEHWEKF